MQRLLITAVNVNYNKPTNTDRPVHQCASVERFWCDGLPECQLCWQPKRVCNSVSMANTDTNVCANMLVLLCCACVQLLQYDSEMLATHSHCRYCHAASLTVDTVHGSIYCWMQNLQLWTEMQLFSSSCGRIRLALMSVTVSLWADRLPPTVVSCPAGGDKLHVCHQTIFLPGLL